MFYNVTRIIKTDTCLVYFWNGVDLIRPITKIHEMSIGADRIRLLTDDGWFEFNCYNIVYITDGTTTKTYTALSTTSGLPSAYATRFQDIWQFLALNILRGCCECGGGTPVLDSCESEYIFTEQDVSAAGIEDGHFAYTGDVSGGQIELSDVSALEQDFSGLFATLPNGSWLKFYDKSDATKYFVVEISNYVVDVSGSGSAVWDAVFIDGDIPTADINYCFSYDIAGSGGGGGVESVTGLDTDNTDPLNPIVQIAVDGVTITGDGTAGNPLVAAGSVPQGWQDTLIVDPDLTQNNTSDAGNFDFTWTNFKTWLLQATSFLNDVVSAIRLRTTGASSTFLIQHDATTNPLQVDVNSSGGTTWNTLGPTRFIGDASNEVDLETTGFGSRRNDLNMKATDNSGTDTPDDRNVINFYNDKNDGNGMRKWFAMRHTDLSTIEVFGIFAYDPAGAAALDRWAFCVTAGAFSNPYSNNTFIGQLSNAGTTAYPFAEKIKDLIANGSLVLMHQNIDIFNTTLLTVANTYADSPTIRFVPRVWVTGDPTELFGAVKHAYQLQQQFSAVNGDSAWQVGFKDAETDLLPATARSFFVYYNGDVRLGAYPSSRNDGSTSSALYVDANGYIKYGPISGGGVTPAAMTKTDDTNVTLTLGGTPATSLLQAVSLTLGWTGILSIARGGTNSNAALSNNRVMQSSAGAIVEAAAITAARALKSDANGIPVHFDTATEPSLTELSYVKGVTSAIQTQIDAKLSTYHAPFCIDCNSDQVNASSTSYYNIYPGSGVDGTEATRQNIVPVGGTAKGYAIYTLSTQNASGSLVLTLRKNGAATALTITIAAGSASGIFTDNVNSVAITKQSDLLSHQVLNNSTSATAQIKDISFVIESTE